MLNGVAALNFRWDLFSRFAKHTNDDVLEWVARSRNLGFSIAEWVDEYFDDPFFAEVRIWVELEPLSHDDTRCDLFRYSCHAVTLSETRCGLTASDEATALLLWLNSALIDLDDAYCACESEDSSFVE